MDAVDETVTKCVWGEVYGKTSGTLHGGVVGPARATALYRQLLAAAPSTAWIELSCTQCTAQPGEHRTIRYSDGSSAEAKIPHRERTLAAKKAAGPR
ncbi:hypothetical protein [Streptomyces sp. NPDC091212]|uniref:hypothetical protein n=1 Tax=Streptomyces sp. NPDC091212 TaxID=3155191 RepID=UPI003418732C